MGNDETMKTKGVLTARYHCKGGGGVERGGDPCGRPAGMKYVVLQLVSIGTQDGDVIDRQIMYLLLAKLHHSLTPSLSPIAAYRVPSPLYLAHQF
jgi:hypothetical protein